MHSQEKFMMIELHAIFLGRVQGVGFRWTVVDYAEKHHLKGSVENLSDGTVEVYAQGPRADLKAFLVAIQADPGGACISSVRTHFHPAQHSYPSFRIMHSKR
jgi:acylphosphatase